MKENILGNKFLIGCQGTKGNNTDLAYKQLFINFPHKAVFLKDVKNVYKALKNKEIDFALVPIKKFYYWLYKTV